ncbi:MAG: SGNH/GDSL hydrolase family protein [Fusobacterium sp.]|nr:SGNH/GDSL hydrolase family protein [Fusobacterium sp.]MDO5789192.1 SGNH/GDSL hydrolase family protein [Fusobacterium sp.]
MSLKERINLVKQQFGISEVDTLSIEKALGKKLVDYESIDALVAALMGYYNSLIVKKMTQANNIEELKTYNLKVGDIIEVLGYYQAGDGANHKRKIESENDGSGVQLNNKLWANLIKPISFTYSNFDDLKNSNIFIGAKAIVYGLVFDIQKTLPEEVGFEDELHIKTKNNFYANFNLDESKFDYIIKKQNEYIGKYLDLNARGQEVNIVLQGDSITYGHDEFSDDKVSPPSTILPDGSKHTNNRSPYPINVKLQEYLRQVTGRTNINVINRGYSGDWAQKSYTRWRITANSNLTLFLLGQNDQGGSWVPEKYRTYQEFIKWNLMLGIREILRGSAVVFTNGYRAKNLNSGTVRQTFLEMNKSIADIIGAIFFDTTDFLLGADNSFFSDDVHLNSKGNAKVASRMCAFFLGENIIKPVKIKNDGYLGVSYDYYNIYSNGNYGTSDQSNGIYNANKYQCEFRTLKKEQYIYFPFYLESEESELLLLSGNLSFHAEIELDFGTEQYLQTSNYILGADRQDVSSKRDFWTSDGNGTLKVLGKGFHILRVSNIGDNEGYLNGIIFKPIIKNRVDIILNTPTISGSNLAIEFTKRTTLALLNYNNCKIQGYITSNTEAGYYETYRFGSGNGLKNSDTFHNMFVIKIYCSTWKSVERVFVFKLPPGSSGQLEFIHETTAFNIPE